MSQFNDLAMKNNIDLDDCIIFVHGNDEILAVNVRNVGIRQRQDDTMGVNFEISPAKTKELENFFTSFANGEKFYYNISQTGYRPVYYRGLSSVTRKVSSTSEDIFRITLIMQKAIVEPEDSYFEPTCECCKFCHIE